jgi:hypothetical protein
VTTGVYERILLASLQNMHAGPWQLADLVKVEGAITEEICSRLSGETECHPAAVADWLRTLSGEERRELLQRLNAESDSRSANGN